MENHNNLIKKFTNDYNRKINETIDFLDKENRKLNKTHYENDYKKAALDSDLKLYFMNYND